MAPSRKPKTVNPDKVDPSVYYYDEVYDDMKLEQEAERSRGKRTSSKDRQYKSSKYIDGLKETAELRKTEKELRKFKKYARDREQAEAEGDLSNEDVYISDSYRRKLAEVKQLEAEKVRQDKRDQDRTMNFMKRHSRVDRGDSTRTSGKRHKREKDRSPDEPTGEREAKIRDQDSTREAAIRRRPKTIEERRKYLRDVLKKRTVGRVYDEALKRYMQRKALSQR